MCLLDNWAALVVDNGNYRVYSHPGKLGSVVLDAASSGDRERFAPKQGVPGVWVKDVVKRGGCSVVEMRIAPPSGRLVDLLKVCKQEDFVQDARVEQCRRENPY